MSSDFLWHRNVSVFCVNSCKSHVTNLIFMTLCKGGSCKWGFCYAGLPLNQFSSLTSRCHEDLGKSYVKNTHEKIHLGRYAQIFIQ